MISEEEWRNAEATKDRILKENNARVQELLNKEILLSLDYKNKKLPIGGFKYQMLLIRHELAEIKKRNFELVQKWIAADNEYRAQDTDRYGGKTLEEIKPELKKGNIEIEDWRLEV